MGTVPSHCCFHMYRAHAFPALSPCCCCPSGCHPLVTTPLWHGAALSHNFTVRNRDSLNLPCPPCHFFAWFPAGTFGCR
ncbi:hypothetical protein CIB84_010183 [Bambusicola thoracicus]|uniref:Uncharacterized protein n=1 Tax=Bambusicola thoracicus TaxID=9083 RepID=A0A2P4SPL7_BAMTH|nr:hypothetical protein CIB84_010183 [Bambusicola thoracicus]